MTQEDGTVLRPTKIKIAGLKEPIVWIKDEKDNEPVGWMAGIGIEGLIPDLFKCIDPTVCGQIGYCKFDRSAELPPI
jgi:hypothetical protein